VGCADQRLCAAVRALDVSKLTEAVAGAKLAADVPVVSQLLTGTAMTRNQFFKQKSMVDAFEAAQLDFGNADADSFALQRADTRPATP
jgi:conjugal transfer mating pair stabilization protein TraG